MLAPDDDVMQCRPRAGGCAGEGRRRRAAALLDDEFTWVDFNGRILDKRQRPAPLPKPPLGDETG